MPGIELIDRRTRNNKTYRLGAQKYALECNIGAIHYKDNPNSKAEQWKDIDTTIVDGRVTRAPFDLDIYLTGMPGFHYKSKESGEFDIRLKAARANSLSSILIAPIIPKPIIKGNTVTWPDIYTDVDVILEVQNNRVILKRIIKSANAPLEYDVDINIIKKGKAQVMPIQPAIDSDKQAILMVQKPTDTGRTETLKLEVIIGAGDTVTKPIKFPIIDSTVVDEDIQADADDTYGHAGYFNATSNLTAGNHLGNAYRTTFNFLGVEIANGATIEDGCYLSIYTWWGGTADCYVHAEDAADAVSPTDSTEIMAIVLTTAKATWANIPDADGYTNSPEIKAVIQELVDTYDYSGGSNNLQIVLDSYGGSNNRTSLKDYSQGGAAKLYIIYTEAGGGIIPLVMHHRQQLGVS